MTVPVLRKIYYVAKKNMSASFRVSSTIDIFFLFEISADLVHFPISKLLSIKN